MDNAIVRLEKIDIHNFKNVINGALDFSSKEPRNKANLLGLYGQNGSGKTALIDALALLKFVLSGMPVPPQYGDYVHINADEAFLEYLFSISQSDSDKIYYIKYSLHIKKAKNEVPSQSLAQSETSYKTAIFNEILSYGVMENGKTIVKRLPLMNTSSEDVAFTSNSAEKYDALTGDNEKKATDLLVIKGITFATSRSFVFSQELLNYLQKYCKNEEYKFIFNCLKLYGIRQLFVFENTESAMISFNALPLSFSIGDNTHGAAGNIVVPFSGNGLIPKEALDLVEKVIENMNIVLNQLVPGLTVELKRLGQELLPNNETGYRVQLLSLKNGKEIPFCYESEGIKKIVAILQLLILVYNRPSVTVVIDELDAGLFEYLLGELLRIISQSGKGQLIFTSHNLRPLETIDKSFVAFTTTNPQKRYIRLTNVKTTNNLRSFYYRDITLGEQTEKVYETTNNHEIALAFKKAGESCGT